MCVRVGPKGEGGGRGDVCQYALSTDSYRIANIWTISFLLMVCCGRTQILCLRMRARTLTQTPTELEKLQSLARRRRGGGDSDDGAARAGNEVAVPQYIQTYHRIHI